MRCVFRRRDSLVAVECDDMQPSTHQGKCLPNITQLCFDLSDIMFYFCSSSGAQSQILGPGPAESQRKI